MDFYKYKCPVCNKQFKEGDDIVVCPECGTPHHRECYEQEEHCFYQDKHSQNFSFEMINRTVPITLKLTKRAAQTMK